MYRCCTCRIQFDKLQTGSLERLSQLEAGLLTLGQFEEAYDELKEWLTRTRKHLENPDQTRADTEHLKTLLDKHKVTVHVTVHVTVDAQLQLYTQSYV